MKPLDRGRHGFTLVEMLIVVLIIGIVSSIALPHYQQVLLKARAAEAIGNMDAIRVAAYNYFLDNHAWPDDVERGVTPPELAPLLPDDFAFERDGYTLDWDNWSTGGGGDFNGTVGISMVTSNTDLGNAFLQLLGAGTSRLTIGDHYTVILSSP